MSLNKEALVNFDKLAIKVISRFTHMEGLPLEDLVVVTNDGRLRVDVLGNEVLELVLQGQQVDNKVYVWLEGLLVSKVEYYGDEIGYHEHMLMNLIELWELNRMRQIGGRN